MSAHHDACFRAQRPTPPPLLAAAAATELVELRQRFEADKKRIAELRVARRFRPY